MSQEKNVGLLFKQGCVLKSFKDADNFFETVDLLFTKICYLF